jgi:hypothetical protein
MERDGDGFAAATFFWGDLPVVGHQRGRQEQPKSVVCIH